MNHAQAVDRPGNIRIVVVFGGRSAERAVSKMSAAAVVSALKGTEYEVLPVLITETGRWVPASEPFGRLDHGRHELRDTEADLDLSDLDLSDRGLDANLLPVFASGDAATTGAPTVVFPVLHGPMGEDGTVQGFLETLNVAYVGPGVLGSALCMDKVKTKEMLRHHGIPVAPFHALHETDDLATSLSDVIADLGFPLFVKPSNMGSSVGIARAEDAAQLERAVENAFAHDEWIVVEKAIHGREIELGVLGRAPYRVSVPGEIRHKSEFYDFSTKYSEGSTELVVPAELDLSEVEVAQKLARRACEILRVEGMARVDFFYDEEGDGWTLNEVNTIPGFTSTSMYPVLWAASGVEMKELVDELVDTALQRHERHERRRRRSHELTPELDSQVASPLSRNSEA